MAKGILSGMAWGAVGGTALLTVLSLYTPMGGEKVSPADAEAKQATQDTVEEVTSLEIDTQPAPEVVPEILPETVVEAAPEIAPEIKEDVVAIAPDVQSTAPEAALTAPEESAPLRETTTAEAKPSLPSVPSLSDAPLEQEVEFTRPENPDDPVTAIVIAEAPQEPVLPSQSNATPAPAPSVAPAQLADAPISVTQPAQDETPAADDRPSEPFEVAELEIPELGPFTVNETPTQESAKPRIIFPSFDNNVEPEDETEIATDSDTEAAEAGEADVTPISSNTPIVLQVPNTENQATGVVVNRLPSLRTPDTAEAEEPEAEDAVPADLTGLGALQAFASDIDVAEADSLLGVILVHAGADGVSAEELTKLELPFSIAIDPAQPGAKEAAATYRAAGIEVLAMVNDLPQSAEPSDVAVAMEGYFGILDEAVAVLDPLDARLQSNRDLLEPVLDAISETGHGLVTYDRGLNTAQQTARRQDVAAATVFRLLDGDLEQAPKIKRYLSRAAFTAAQDGSVLVLGRAYPDTVAALVEWALDDKGADIAVVPVSKIMLGDAG